MSGVEELTNRFSIGEMSRLHNIPIKTLRYYDEIGLFKPDYVEETNKYRYYSVEQFEKLNTIKYLRFLGLSLKEIQQHLAIRDGGAFLELLKKQKAMTQATMEHLTKITHQFSKRIEEIEAFLECKTFGEPTVKSLPSRSVLRVFQTLQSEWEWELALRKLMGDLQGIPSPFIGRVGLTVSEEHLHSHRFDIYNSVFVLWEELFPEGQEITCLPEGEYACIYYQGNHQASKPYYGKLLCFIRENAFTICGDGVERTVINQYITANADKYITEIQIPIQRRA